MSTCVLALGTHRDECVHIYIHIMTDRETPLAKIVGQMLLSKNTDVSTQSWVFIVYTDEDPGLGRNVCIF